MTTNPFKKATRSQSKLRMAIMGASGSGKSYTALKIASGLGSKIAAIDTERGSLSKYAGLGVEFDVLELTDYNPRNYINAIQAAVANGYDVLVIDSLSHAWSGTGGILETVDKVAKRSQSNNSFAAWRDVTPLHNQLVDTILGAGIHIIVTMRSKTEYVMEKNERTGKTEPRKVGLAPVQRDGMEYEFDVCAEMDTDHNFTITKTRCIDLDNAVITKPDAQLGETLKAWLSDGEVVAQKPAPPVETVTILEPGRPKNPALAGKWSVSHDDILTMYCATCGAELNDDWNCLNHCKVVLTDEQQAKIMSFTVKSASSPDKLLEPADLADVFPRDEQPEQPTLGLVDSNPQHPKSKRTWDLGRVKTYTIQERKYIAVKGATPHFDALISKLEASLRITDTSTTEDVCAAIDKHYNGVEQKAG